MPMTPRVETIFQAQIPGHYPEWNDSLRYIKEQGNNDAK